MYSDIIKSIDYRAINGVVNTILKCERVFVAGNGGSASNSEHFVQGLISAGVDATSLVSNPAVITCIANDFGYDNIFKHQLENIKKCNGVLIVISASGNSTNLIEAVSYFNTVGSTVGILGFDGGVLNNICSQVILVRTKVGEYALVEDVHSVICHYISSKLSGGNYDAIRYS